MDLGIGLAVLGVIMAIVFWWIPKESIVGLFEKYSVKNYVNRLNLRTDFRIAIIDDEIDSYPIKYIKDLGFSIKEYETVSFADSDILIKNDLLLLDVKGVVNEDLDEGGAKLIKIIKESRPLLPIVAVSSGYFQTELNDYFKISDATLNKPIDEYRIREMLNELKKEFFDVDCIANSIEDCIKKLELSPSKKNKLKKELIGYLSNKINKECFNNFVHQLARSSSQEIIDKSEILVDRINND
ncbi:hypothetical protein [Vibrio rumoiensis]|uniref:hypothetical protein n=1 Tax=Vibrio rumoiensis TaxID=76258 RepID=UPI003AA946B1